MRRQQNAGNFYAARNALAADNLGIAKVTARRADHDNKVEAVSLQRLCPVSPVLWPAMYMKIDKFGTAPGLRGQHAAKRRALFIQCNHQDVSGKGIGVLYPKPRFRG